MVYPLIIKVAAIPLEAVAITILFNNISFFTIKFITNVFPVPPGASKNIKPGSLSITLYIKVLYTVCYCEFNLL